MAGRTDRNVDVIIVGAGPTGLLLAGELKRRGCSVFVADRGPGPSVHSKALAIHSRSLEMFATLGLERVFLERGLKLNAARIFAGGEERTTIPLDEIDSEYPFVLSLPQSETERILLERFGALDGEVAWDTTVADVAMSEDGARIRCQSGDGGATTVTGSWLVGCDGAHSTVRDALEIGWTGDDIDLHFAFADLHLESSVLRNDAFQVFLLDDSRVIAIIPMPGDGFFRVINTLHPRQVGRAQDEAFFRALLEEEVDPDVEVRDAVWFSEFTVRQRIARCYRKGRAFIAGDAAHAHSPAGGQGMNTGLQDAHNLGWKLAAVIRGEADASLLDSYETERRPVASEVVAATGAGTQAVGALPAWRRTLRNLAVTVLPKIGPVRRRLLDLISEVAVDYRDSDIVVDELGLDAGEVRAGEFAPNLDLSDGARLYDVLGDGHVVVTDADTPVPDEAAAFDAVGVPRSVLKATGAVRGGLFIIRPDGYVGFSGRSDDIDQMVGYLRRVA